MKRSLTSQISKDLLLFLLLLTIGACLRFWRLGSLPETMHRDEAAIGYNAYSVAKTGSDEHGQPWPANFKSFGDYKLPGMVYTVLVSLKFFGLNATAVRFPTAVASVFTLAAIYWLSREMGWSKRISLIAMIFLTFSFFHISQARNTYEPMVGLFFSVFGWASWLAGKRNWRWYGLALLSYIVGSLFYNLPFLLMPMLFAISWLIIEHPLKHWSKIWRLPSLWAMVGLVISIVALSLLFQSSNAGKSGITILKSAELIEIAKNSIHAALVAGVPSPLARVMNHFTVYSILQFCQGYLVVFNPVYVFFAGDPNAWHNLRSIGLGNQNPVLMIPYLMGLYVILKNGTQKKVKLLAAYLCLSPIVSALTIDSPVTNRLLDFNTAVVLVSAVGASELIRRLWQSKKKLHRIFFIMGLFFYFGFFVLFGIRYFFSFNQLLPKEWNPGLNSMIEWVQENQTQYDWVYITPNLDLAYIHLAFRLPFDPYDFQHQAKWRTNGFEYVTEYGKYRFDRFPGFNYLDSKSVSEMFDDAHKRFLIIEKGEPPVKTELLWLDKDWGGRWRWYAWETNLNLAIAELETMAPTPDKLQTLQYLYSCQNGNCDKSVLTSLEEIQ